MFRRKKYYIILIFVEGDPAAKIGHEEAGGQNLYVPSSVVQSEQLDINPKKFESGKKKLFMIAEFIAVTGVGWLDPTIGLGISIVLLIWHVLKD